MNKRETVKNIRLYLTQDEGAGVNDDDRVSSYIHEFIGSVVKELIRTGSTVGYEELTAALYRLGENTDDAEVRQRCGELIVMLRNKKH